MALPPNQMPPPLPPIVGNDPMDELKGMRAEEGRGLQGVPPLQPQGTGIPIPQAMEQGTSIPLFTPEKPRSLHDILGPLREAIATNMVKMGVEGSILEELERMYEPQEPIEPMETETVPMEIAAAETVPMETGGLISLAGGGEFAGRVPGKGHGMEDNVRMPIEERGKQVATLAVSPSEYVVDSHTMAALGNGNADRGADVMDATVKQIRQKAYGTEKQPREISGIAALKPLIERV